MITHRYSPLDTLAAPNARRRLGILLPPLPAQLLPAMAAFPCALFLVSSACLGAPNKHLSYSSKEIL